MSRSSITKQSVLFRGQDEDTYSNKVDYYDQSGNWRNVIFLPHYLLWKSILVCTVILNALLVNYFLAFENDFYNSYLPLYYACEFYYFLYTILNVMHRFMVKYRNTKTFLPRNMLFITIDVISLLPYYEIYYLLTSSSKGQHYKFAKDHMKLKVFLRLHTISHFLSSAANEPGLNHILVAFITQIIYFCLYTVSIASVWFWIKDLKKAYVWTDNLKYHQINNNSMLDWYILSTTFVGNVLAHNWAGLITPKNLVECPLIIVTMLIGFIMHMMIFFGRLTALYIKKLNYQFEFTARVSMIGQLMDCWRLPENTKVAAVDYYKLLWETRFGIKFLAKDFRSLPLSLQREPGLDIYCHTYKHTHFFAELDNGFKRYISVSNECNLYAPGDYLYTTNELKSKMMYVVSGVVQVLSQEDQVSPVMSFSSGTVIGEAMCLMCNASKINLRCATYCEIHTIHLSNMCRALTHFPSISKILHKKLLQRIDLAKEMQHVALLKLKDRDQKRTSIRWMKHHWRQMATLSRSAKRATEEKIKAVNPAHTSKHLNLYVLSDEVELKVKTICLNASCPFIIEPTSSFSKFCEYLILGATIVQNIALPYVAIFNRRITYMQYGLFYMLDLFYVLGLYLEASTAFTLKNHLISDIKDIIIYKFKQIGVVADVLATVPMEFVCFFRTCNEHLVALLHLNRVLKIYRLFKLINAIERNIWVDVMKIRLIKCFVQFTCSIYFASCIFYGLSCFVECDKTGWLHYNTYLRRKFKIMRNESETELPFLSSTCYVVSMVVGLAMNSIYCFNIKEIIFESMFTVFGYFLVSFSFAELAACAVLQLNSKNQYEEYLRGIKHFIFRKNIHQDLRDILYSILHCQWQYSKRFAITGDDNIFYDLPEVIKSSVVHTRIVDCLNMIPLFAYCGEDIVWKIAKMSEVSVLPPNTIILRDEIRYTHFNIILRGHCRAISSIPTDKYHGSSSLLSRGSMFPVMEPLMKINTFISVISETFVEIIKVDCVSMNIILKRATMYQELFNDLHIVIKKEMETHKTILSRQKGRLPEMVPPCKSYGRGEYFSYKTDDNYNADLQKLMYTDTFNRMGKWRFVRHFLLRNTFHPLKKFYLSWEVFRCTISFIQVFYTMNVSAVFMFYKVHRYVDVFFLMIALVDFYIRLHCCYYNSKGVLVSHSMYTAKHYLTTSFLLDLYCVIPIRNLQMHQLFGHKYNIHALVVLHFLTRPFLLHRVFSGLTFLQKNIRKTQASIVLSFKYITLVFVVLSVLAAFLQATTCSLDIASKCPEDTWISHSLFRDDNSSVRLRLYSFYFIVTIFSVRSTGEFSMEGNYEKTVILIIIFLLFSTRLLLLAKLTSFAIGGNTRLVEYQHNMKSFLSFVKKYHVTTELVDATVRHFENSWKRTNGYATTDILKTFHPVLEADIAQHLYMPTLKLIEIFAGADESVLRYLSTLFIERHYMKDSEIIRCNDVQEYVYIVYKGRVKISVANDKLCMLSTGGLFGCLGEKNITRQTINARATIHVDVLIITANTLNDIINEYPAIKLKMKRARFFNKEYLLPISVGKEPEVSKKSLIRIKSVRTLYVEKGFLISPDSRWYIAYKYIVNVHLAILSPLILMTLLVGVGDFTILNFNWIMYVFDSIFLTKIVFGFHASYVDPESGLHVTRMAHIWRKYLRSVNGFWLDTFTCLPIELMAKLVSADIIIIKLCWLNRILRFLFMINYYNNCRNMLTVSKHLGWTILLYTVIFLLHCMVCVWWIVACIDGRCPYRTSMNNEKGDYSMTPANDEWIGFAYSYQYVVNIFTTTGLRFTAPRTAMELTVTLIMTLVSQFTALALTAMFASMLVLENFMMNTYEGMVSIVLHFMTWANVSPPMKNKLLRHYCEMWTKFNGYPMPKLIKATPPYLQQDLMSELFMSHLTTHFLFKKTHVDFLRQLAIHFRMQVYLPEYFITEKGDVDETMYFIVDGEVIVYDVHGNNEIEQAVIGAGKSFGEAQGLYNVEHEYSYKARYMTTMILLKKSEWQYLLKWFPASEEYIVEQAQHRFNKHYSMTHDRFDITEVTLV